MNAVHRLRTAPSAFRKLPFCSLNSFVLRKAGGVTNPRLWQGPTESYRSQCRRHGGRDQVPGPPTAQCRTRLLSGSQWRGDKVRRTQKNQQDECGFVPREQWGGEFAEGLLRAKDAGPPLQGRVLTRAPPLRVNYPVTRPQGHN